MPQGPQHSGGTTFSQQMNVVNKLMRVSALTVMVYLRRDLGYRFLNPVHLFCINGTLILVAILNKPAHPELRLDDVILFAIFAFLIGMGQRNKRYRELKRGIMKHSYYIGTSHLDFIWLPNFVRRNRKIARLVDPAFCALAGLILLPYSRALAFWLIFAAFCLRSVEYEVNVREHSMDLDMIDSLIVSGAQHQNVEHFDELPAARQQQPITGIPTGLSSDIQQHLKRRRKK